MPLLIVTDPPPPPGPRPPAFTFPFAAAQRLLAALQDAAGDLTGLAGVHRDAAADARVGFEGATRRNFDAALGDLLGALGNERGRLRADAATLAATVAQARTRQQATDDALAAWDQRQRAYRAALAAQE